MKVVTTLKRPDEFRERGQIIKEMNALTAANGWAMVDALYYMFNRSERYTTRFEVLESIIEEYTA